MKNSTKVIAFRWPLTAGVNTAPIVYDYRAADRPINLISYIKHRRGCETCGSLGALVYRL